MEWNLSKGRYRVYGRLDSQSNSSAPDFTPRQSTTSTKQPLLPGFVKVKIEPGMETVTLLSSDDEDSGTVVRSPKSNIQLSSRRSSVESTLSSRLPKSSPSIQQATPGIVSVIVGLKRLSSRAGSKNPLKSLDFEAIPHRLVGCLPHDFNNDTIFELPPAPLLASSTQARNMHGMDKRYDGHVWTKTITTNIRNDDGLHFRTSKCVDHLQCSN